MRTMIIAAAMVAASCAHAEPWSLNKCIDYAIEHNISLKINKVSIDNANLAIDQAKSRYLPTVNGQLSQSWNLGRGLTAENTYADRNTTSFNWGVNGQIQLFDGLATPRRIAYAKANLVQITEQYEAAKEDLTVNIIAQYLQALYTVEMLDVAKRQVELSEYELTRQNALLEAGKIPEADILEAEAQLAADNYSQVQAFNDMMLARIELANLLQYKGDIADFEVVPLDQEESMILPADEVYNLALQHNHSIRAGREGITVAEKNIEVAKTGYYPTVSFGTSIGSSYYGVSGMPNEGFFKQMGHNYSTYFGFNVNIPIYDGKSTKNSIKQAEIEKLNAQLQLDQASEQLYRTIQQAYYQAKGAAEKLESSKVNERAANLAFESMQEKYNIGRAKPTEYQQAKAKAYKATADRLQAAYELILRTRILQFYARN